MFKDHNPPVVADGFSSDEVMSEPTGPLLRLPTVVVIPVVDGEGWFDVSPAKQKRHTHRTSQYQHW